MEAGDGPLSRRDSTVSSRQTTARESVGRASRYGQWLSALRDALSALNPKHLIVGLITLILVAGELRYGILGSYWRLAAALGTCVAAEFVFARLVPDRSASPVSAYITGVSLAILTKPQSNILWPFFLGGVMAIGSKYVLRYRGRHLWNPSNFGIGALLLVSANHVAILSEQWGNALATNAVIWAIGLLVVYRARMLHVTVTYLLSFLGFAVLRSAVVGTPILAEIGPVTGPMYQLLVLFMITDPATTVSTRKGRMLVAFSIAAVEMGIRLAADFHVDLLSPLYHSPPILALFLVGPAAMWLEQWRKGRETARASG